MSNANLIEKLSPEDFRKKYKGKHVVVIEVINRKTRALESKKIETFGSIYNARNRKASLTNNITGLEAPTKKIVTVYNKDGFIEE